MKLFFKIIFRELYHLFKSKKSRAFLWLVLKLGDKKRYQPCQVKYSRYYFSIPDALSFVWQIKEIFVDESYAFTTQEASPIIYVCGANVGVDCLYFKENYPQARIKAFEADPQIVKYLKNNLITNQCKAVEVIAKAVWVHNEGIEMQLEGADGGSIFGEGNKVTVESTRLKTWLLQESSIDMLKMDIEGAEVSVLEDCGKALEKVSNLFVEYHAYTKQPQALHKLISILSAAGFRYYVQEAIPRKKPLVNHQYRNQQVMDLQLNIYAYRLK